MREHGTRTHGTRSHGARSQGTRTHGAGGRVAAADATRGQRAPSARVASMRRHPTTRPVARPVTPPPTAFYVIGVVAAVFTMLGLVMVFSATSVREFHKGNSPWSVWLRQALWASLGVIGMYAAMRLPLRFWKAFVGVGYVVALGLMALPFVPGIGVTVNDARSWVQVAGFTFQPSEFLKLAMLLAAAKVLAQRKDEMANLDRTLVPVLVMGGLAAIASGLQGDLGSAIVLSAMLLALLFIAGAPLGPTALTAVLGGGLMALRIMSSPRRLARFTAFLDIAAHRDTLSYQTWQSMIALAQGGVTGSGVGRGGNKLGDFLPLAQSDFIFAVIAEELGLIGVVAVLGGFIVLAYSGMQVAMATVDRFHALVAGGIVCWFSTQAIINVGGVVGLMPVTGLTLPFFSVGGSSLFVTLVATGLLLNVARNVR